MVWFVSTDQKDLAAAIVGKFDERSRGGSGSGSSGGNRTKQGRRVITTKNEGLHSAPKFKEQMGLDLYGKGVVAALKDWWLLGEADLGVFTPQAEVRACWIPCC